MNLVDLLKIGFEFLERQLPEGLDHLLGSAGQQAADAVVKKVYLQQTARYQGAPADVGKDGKTNVQRLAQDGFLDFERYLRKGNEDFPGAPDIPALEPGADAVYDIGSARTQIHNWCNASAANLLASPPQ